MNYECECGERHLTASGARSCRKCREYLADEDQTGRVIDLHSGAEVSPVGNLASASAAELANYEAWKAEQGWL